MSEKRPAEGGEDPPAKRGRWEDNEDEIEVVWDEDEPLPPEDFDYDTDEINIEYYEALAEDVDFNVQQREAHARERGLQIIEDELTEWEEELPYIPGERQAYRELLQWAHSAYSGIRLKLKLQAYRASRRADEGEDIQRIVAARNFAMIELLENDYREFIDEAMQYRLRDYPNPITRIRWARLYLQNLSSQVSPGGEDRERSFWHEARVPDLVDFDPTETIMRPDAPIHPSAFANITLDARDIAWIQRNMGRH